ncbi:hypothetical protein KY284_005275 [Solanum tuberosum]|nr:hypothetical protein KY284_005275 [Solanum tuberosum]
MNEPQPRLAGYPNGRFSAPHSTKLVAKNPQDTRGRDSRAPRSIIVTQLMGFWEPSTVTFKCLDFEISLILEEFSSLIELPIRGRLPVIPSTICTSDFVSLLDLHIFRSLRYVDGGHAELDYLFQRLGHLEGYYEYQREFECTRGAWEHMRPRVFVMAF